ncbi:MAG: hypothetical protein EXS19_05150 [Pedosphaera sp.]|nr:hypothetical protein [Pedosphaera sp.]
MRTSLLITLSLASAAAFSIRAQTVINLPATPSVGQPIVGGIGGTPFVLLQPNSVHVTRVTNGFASAQTGGVTIGEGQ